MDEAFPSKSFLMTALMGFALSISVAVVVLGLVQKSILTALLGFAITGWNGAFFVYWSARLAREAK